MSPALYFATLGGLAGLPLVTAAADRFAGGPWMGSKPVLHPRYVSALALATYSGLAFGPPAVMLGAAFLCWRSLGWEHFGGRMDPATPRQIFGLFVVHSAMIPLLCISALAMHRPVLVAALAGLGFAYWGAFLGHMLWTYAQRGRDINAWIEAARGFGLGLMLATVLL